MQNTKTQQIVVPLIEQMFDKRKSIEEARKDISEECSMANWRNLAVSKEFDRRFRDKIDGWSLGWILTDEIGLDYTGPLKWNSVTGKATKIPYDGRTPWEALDSRGKDAVFARNGVPLSQRIDMRAGEGIIRVCIDKYGSMTINAKAEEDVTGFYVSVKKGNNIQMHDGKLSIRL